MKVCKNCGRQTDDGKVRCPYCGYLFEEDMDSVLRKMKENLNSYKDSVANAPVPPAQPQYAPPAQQVQQPQAAASQLPAQDTPPAAQPQYAPQGQPVQAAPVQLAQGYAAVQDAGRERFELLSEVAQLKGELRALHTEIDRMNANSAAGYAAQPQYVPQGQPVQAAAPQAPVQYAPQPVQYAQPAVYPNAPYGQPAYAQPQAEGRQKPGRSANRIVLSVIGILLLALSIGMFFLPWIEWTVEMSGSSAAYSFEGFGGVLYIFNRNHADAAGFASFLTAIEAHEFAGGEMIANICRNACLYIVEYGVLVYAVLLVLGFPLLFSLFGRVSCKGWHRFVAWMSFIVALLLFGVFCWVAGFSAMTIWFLVGAAANFVRCLFLIFYKGKKRKQGGLE